jgi:hypothetical protein
MSGRATAGVTCHSPRPAGPANAVLRQPLTALSLIGDALNKGVNNAFCAVSEIYTQFDLSRQ